MKYIDEFRDKHISARVAAQIRKRVEPGRTYNIMEVCGTHTMSIFRFGLRDLLPKNINLISGPGCPVCVTPNEYLDKAIAIAALDNVIIATFGDLFRVPGSRSSLEKERAKGKDIRMVYSSLDALEIAKKNPDKEVVFLGIGFETTIPTVAVSILMAKKEKIKNYSVLSGHKTMPEVLKSLASDKSVKVNGFLLPGHVSAIIGTRPYAFLAKAHKKRCVVTGFEPLDILQGILMLITQKKPKVDIQYTRIMEKSGNIKAEKSIEKVFQKTASEWRGIGNVKNSGLKIRKEFASFDADHRFRVKIGPPKEHPGCICGSVLKGIKTPLECKLFAKVCNPQNPVGSCMVSGEGTCAAYYRYSSGISS
jgi:hydrogenase expression/formation protein HypD